MPDTFQSVHLIKINTDIEIEVKDTNLGVEADSPTTTSVRERFSRP